MTPAMLTAWGWATRLLLITSILLLLATPAPTQQAAPLAFGVLNQQSPALTAERWNPILAYVSATSGVPLQLKMGRTVQETDTMMGRGDFDFVFTNHNFQSDSALARARWQASVLPLYRCLRGLRGAGGGAQAGGRSRRGSVRG